jgi:hypothetical protein
MRIKRFDDFNSPLNESRHSSREYSYSDYFEGKNKFSKWLRGVSNNLKWDAKELQDQAADSKSNISGGQTVSSIRSIFPTLGRVIFGAGAAVADFFSKGDSKDSLSKLSKKDIKTKKEELLDDWEKRQLKGKKIEQTDAEKFYKSGVLKGKGYFGKEYNPLNPKNDDERAYSEYLGGAMSRYYDKIENPIYAKREKSS